ncbi:hypothetical protein V5O48_007119 [Marasmius crinis-equi]|uniref:Uncharacterized protein n=1 Tax=Marasmius crinis-equi TaxID=585013 RepID=A0ABR3FHK3_9AGAR
MPRSARYTSFPSFAFPVVPPVSLADISLLEKVLVRKELAEALSSKIEAAAGFRGVRDRRYGHGHTWSPWKVSLGVTHWPDVGRLARKCYSICHWRERRDCTKRARFMTPRLSREQLVEIEEMRAFYDVLGGKKWSATTNPGGSAEVERARWIRFMWRERQHGTLETLGAVYWRLLDHPTDEEYNSTGWDTDSTASDASWFVEETDSDEEVAAYMAASTEDEGESDSGPATDGATDRAEEDELIGELQEKGQEQDPLETAPVDPTSKAEEEEN